MYNLIKNTFELGEFNNYLIGGNLVNEFALGEVGSPDDFFLIGAEPYEESPFPILSGNILDSNGDLLFKLVRNIIVSNPKNCYKISGDFIGYEIRDSEDVLILKVETKFERLSEPDIECYITTIKANFYNKEKQLVFLANSGEENESLDGSCKMVLGNGISVGYNPEEEDFIRFTLSSNGKIYEILKGDHINENIKLDGKCLINASLNNCKILISTGDFASIGDNFITECGYTFHGNALNIFNIVKDLKPR